MGRLFILLFNLFFGVSSTLIVMHKYEEAWETKLLYIQTEITICI